jgi:hypothetical protein
VAASNDPLPEHTSSPETICDCRRVLALVERIYEAAHVLAEDGELPFDGIGSAAAEALRILRQRGEVAA